MPHISIFDWPAHPPHGILPSSRPPLKTGHFNFPGRRDRSVGKISYLHRRRL